MEAKHNVATEEDTASGRLGSLTVIWPFVRPYRKLLVTAIITLLFTAGIALTIPMAFRLVVDGFAEAASQTHGRYFVVAICAVGLLAVGSSVRNYLTKILGERVALDMRKTMFARLIHMSPEVLDRMMTGEVLSRITSDTTLIQVVIGQSTSMAMRHTVLFFGGLVMLFASSPKLMVMVILIVPLVMGPIIAIGRWVRINTGDSQKWISKSSAKASEALLAAQAIQSSSAEVQTIASFDDITAKALNSARKAVRSHALMNVIVVMLVFCGLTGIVWTGALEVRAGKVTVGELTQFAFYAIFVATSLAGLSDAWGEVQRAAGAADRLAILLDAEDTVPEPDNPISLAPGSERMIAFENVHFAYPSRPTIPALNGISFSLKAGETVALVGPSGSGKSTVLQVLMRFYDVNQGCVRIDGVDLKDLRRAHLRDQIAIVQQDPAVFATSARDNVRFGRLDATDAEVEAAAKAAYAHEFIMALPDGYDTLLGERGVMLSGGQRQRISIARAILRDAPILLLDEATSALDSESEVVIQNAIKELSADRTSLVIAHRLTTVQKADRILVFSDGKIVSQGTHDELIAEDSLYARYARLQFLSGKES